jgi:SAM-dependent methyltransferase
MKALLKKLRKKWHKDINRNTNRELKGIAAELDDIHAGLMFLMKHSSIALKQEEELAFLFDIYNSDKGSLYKARVHTYADIYHSLFSPIRNEVKAIFECGVFKGGSLRAWRDYFQNAVIIAGDIDESSLFEANRIHTAPLDQMNKDSIAAFFASLPPEYPAMFDIIIDDGCHIYDATTCLFEEAIEHLKPGGFYIIEDMLEKYFQAYEDFFRKYVDAGLVKVDYKNMVRKTGDPHNNLIIIRKAGA